MDTEDEVLRQAAADADKQTLLVLTPFNEQGQFSNELASQMLRSEAARAALAADIRDTVIQKGMSGVDFDFEYVYAEDRESGYSARTRNCSAYETAWTYCNCRACAENIGRAASCLQRP